MFKIAPVLLFAYNRLEALKHTVAALQANVLSRDTELFIFSDGPKNQENEEKVTMVREFLKTITGFKKVIIIESEYNKGLAKSIISGVTAVINDHGSVIVLEDDLVTAPNFLCFMNQCLEHYASNKKVYSVSGYSPPMRSAGDYRFDAYFFPRNTSHGWATWKDRWYKVDWEVSDYQEFISSSAQRAAFNRGGSDLSGMLRNQMEGKINSWSIRFTYHHYKTETCSVYPVISKVKNIGFGKDATHTTNYNRYQTVLDKGTRTEFHLPDVMTYDSVYARNLQNLFSFRARAIGKVKTYLYRMGLLKNERSLQA
jgi:hypothetical protein